MPQITNKHILEKLESLCLLIRGDPKKHEDVGLVGAVNDNTKFRKTTMKFIWVLAGAVVSLWGTIIAQTLMNNGGH